MTVEQKIYEANKIMEWLIDGYFINWVLQSGARGVTAEFIVLHYNVEMAYFKPKT